MQFGCIDKSKQSHLRNQSLCPWQFTQEDRSTLSFGCVHCSNPCRLDGRQMLYWLWNRAHEMIKLSSDHSFGSRTIWNNAVIKSVGLAPVAALLRHSASGNAAWPSRSRHRPLMTSLVARPKSRRGFLMSKCCRFFVSVDRSDFICKNCSDLRIYQIFQNLPNIRQILSIRARTLMIGKQ